MYARFRGRVFVRFQGFQPILSVQSACRFFVQIFFFVSLVGSLFVYGQVVGVLQALVFVSGFVYDDGSSTVYYDYYSQANVRGYRAYGLSVSQF